MKTKKRYTALKIALSLTSVLFGLTASYAWYMYFAGQETEGGMGKVEVAVSEAAEVNEDGIAVFEIINESTIDTYIRIGWTPVYMDKTDGTYLTKDVSGIEIKSAYLTDDSLSEDTLIGLILSPDNTLSFNDYSKKMITLEDTDNKYFVVPAGVKIAGQIELSADTLQNAEPNENIGLYIIFIPEALQATKKAVTAAGDYGWLEAKAYNQARSVFAEGGGY